MGKILDFLVDHMTYNNEVENVFRAPVEALSIRSGDCDDYTALAAALFEAVGIDSAIGYFKSTKTPGSAHHMVLVRLDELNVTDPYYDHVYFFYDDLTGRGLRSGRWIKIEPQRWIDYQGDAEWMDEWELYTAVEVGS